LKETDSFASRGHVYPLSQVKMLFAIATYTSDFFSVVVEERNKVLLFQLYCHLKRNRMRTNTQTVAGTAQVILKFKLQILISWVSILALM